ncbi:glycosyltransferase family 4 protein [Leptolinea tardivitalis]|uniref:glycosyltransferase family 4 protein n=1 Tax=Leptolinea tardivitalis TaxID=229920 RepID=UPI00078429B9|nr:glycosyltransferase family 4 protein [Leptolinea tardivitalis]GAP23071.1 glycosyltransferase [Leptolinea tardivitalis]
MIKVLFVSYPHIGQNLGGMQIQIAKTADQLEKAGIDVVYFDPWKSKLSDVDVVHIFSLHPSIYEFAEIVKAKSKPLIVSSVLNLQDRSLATLSMQVQISKRCRGVFSSIKQSYGIARLADYLIALTDKEKEIIKKAFSISPEKIRVIPNGIDKKFLNATPTLFLEKYGKRDFVLCVGKIEPRKNQLKLIEACKKGNWPLVLIGPANTQHPGYYLECKEKAKESDVLFIDAINNDDPLLASAYSSAKLFALVSESEVFPISVLEASAAGTRIILTERTAMGEVLGNLITYTKPNTTNIYQSIKREWIEEKNFNLKEKITEKFSWESIGAEIIDVYRQVL